MMEYCNLRYNKITRQWYLGFNIESDKALELEFNLKQARAIDCGYEILADKRARNYDSDFDFIVAHSDKQVLLDNYTKIYRLVK